MKHLKFTDDHGIEEMVDALVDKVNMLIYRVACLEEQPPSKDYMKVTVFDETGIKSFFDQGRLYIKPPKD